MLAASLDRLANVHAAIAQLVGEFDDQDAVLGHDADHHDQADLAIGVEAGSSDQQRKDGAGDAERHGRHDDDGADEAFELRGQHQQDDDQGEAEHRHHGAVGLPSVAASASGRMRPPGGTSGAAISSTRSSASPRAKSGARFVVMATDRNCCSRAKRRRHGFFSQRGNRSERHETPVDGLQEDVLHVRRVVDRIARGDKLHRIGAIIDEHVIDLVAVEHGLDRARQTRRCRCRGRRPARG